MSEEEEVGHAWSQIPFQALNPSGNSSYSPTSVSQTNSTEEPTEAGVEKAIAQGHLANWNRSRSENMALSLARLCGFIIPGPVEMGCLLVF